MPNKNLPFRLTTMSAVDFNLLKRVEILETALGQALGVVSKHIPSTEPELRKIGEQAEYSSHVAAEMTAAVFLEYTQKLRIDAPSPEELYNESTPKALTVDAAVQGYFPSVMGQPHVLGLMPAAYGADKAVELEEVNGVSISALRQHPDGFIRSSVLSQNDQAETILLLTSIDDEVPLIIQPSNSGWAFFQQMQDGNDERYFLHRQAQFVKISEIEATLKSLLLAGHPAKVRALFKNDEDAITKVDVLLRKVFASTGANVKVEKEGLYAAMLETQDYKELGKAVLVQSEFSSLRMLLVENMPGIYLVSTDGKQFNRFALDTLTDLSKSLLMEWLKELNKVTKPPVTK